MTTGLTTPLPPLVGAIEAGSTKFVCAAGNGIGGGAVVGGRVVHGLVHPEMGHIEMPQPSGDDFAGACP